MPVWLLDTFVVFDDRWDRSSPFTWLPRSASLALLIIGLLLFTWCILLFARIGRGTLAPWDPTRNLVSVGPYRHVRNPMISAVAMMLFAQALFWGSWLLCLWAIAFVIINHFYFIFSEEPGLEKRFEEAYRAYKADVPRWIPHLRL